MKKTTKHLLGTIGLATVAAITAIAVGVENPASALANINTTSVTKTPCTILSSGVNSGVSGGSGNSNSDPSSGSGNSGGSGNSNSDPSSGSGNSGGSGNSSSTSSSSNGNSTDVVLNYYVADEGKTTNTINSPTNKDETTDESIPVNVGYSNTDTIKYTLTCTDENGETHTIPLMDYDTEDYSSGIHNWSLNLSDYGLGYGTYILNVDSYGNGFGPNSVEFSYLPVIVNPTDSGTTHADDDGNVVTSDDATVDLTFDFADAENPDHGEFQIYNPDGSPYIDPSTGEPVIITVSPADLDSGKFHLDLSKYGLIDGNRYLLTFRCYSNEGTLIGTYTISFIYNGISVPNTGGSLFAGLNLGSSDFLISGLIVFVAITAGAFIVIKKTSSRR